MSLLGWWQTQECIADILPKNSPLSFWHWSSISFQTQSQLHSLTNALSIFWYQASSPTKTKTLTEVFFLSSNIYLEQIPISLHHTDSLSSNILTKSMISPFHVLTVHWHKVYLLCGCLLYKYMCMWRLVCKFTRIGQFVVFLICEALVANFFGKELI